MENHGNRPPLKITEITENHGKSRKRKLKFLLFAIVVPGRHGKSRKITETEIEVPIVCYCCSWSPRKITENHGNGNESSYCLLLLFLVAKC